jgi:sec-independent protein translocase protein TatC
MANEYRLSIIEHLEEFRSRLIISLIAILVTTAIAYVFSDAILHYLRLPAGDIKLQAFNPMDGFMIRFRVALYGGMTLAAPVWIFQLMRYLSPGMTKEEKRYIIPGVAAMVILFFLGNLFGYMMLSNMMSVMFTMFGSELNYLPSADQYISFVVYFLIAVGLSFELPIVILVLMKLGIITPEFLRKQRKVAYFILFVFAELITPVSDPIVAPMVVMAPMVVLFELALFVSRFIISKKPAPALPVKSAPSKPIVPPVPSPAPLAVPAMAATETILPPRTEVNVVGDNSTAQTTSEPTLVESPTQAIAENESPQVGTPDKTVEPSTDANAKPSGDDSSGQIVS